MAMLIEDLGFGYAVEVIGRGVEKGQSYVDLRIIGSRLPPVLPSDTAACAWPMMTTQILPSDVVEKP